MAFIKGDHYVSSVKILLTTVPIEFFTLDKIRLGPEKDLDYFILEYGFGDGFRTFLSLEYLPVMLGAQSLLSMIYFS